GLLLTNAEYNRFQESRADSFAIYAIEKADLADPTVSNLFAYVIAIDSIYNKVEKGKSLKIAVVKNNGKDTTLKPIEKLLRSHPESFKRSQFIDSIIQSEFKISKPLPVNESFTKFHRMAQYEALHLLLVDCEYQKCIDKAFRFYLTDDTNPTFIYYLLEALRRQMYVQPSFGKAKFLSSIYLNYIKESETIFQNLQLLAQDYESANYLANNAYLKKYVVKGDSVVHKSNKKVFTELAELAVEIGINEANFSLGLYEFTRDKNKTLKAYAKDRRGYNDDFAQRVVRDELHKTKIAKKLVLLDDINFIDEKHYGYRILLKQSQRQTNAYMKVIKQMANKKLNEYEVVSVSEMAANDYGKLIRLKESMKTMAIANKKFELSSGSTKRKSGLSTGKEIDIYLLCPELWKTLDEYDIERIDYVSTFSIYFQPTGLRVFQALYPLYIYENVVEGSPVNQYWITQNSFTPYHTSLTSYQMKEIHYKINKYYFTNSLYYLILE
ncbi:MAG: hypothetical protein ACPGLV_17925, partial [Bacteroidia bacterium]